MRIQSVSADPERLQEVERSAERTAELFAAEGVAVEIVRAYDGAPPAVIGEKQGPAGAPTVLLYAHHDVQPENDHADWDSAPWEPTERDGRLYGRGAADDKAGIMAHVGALRVFGDDLPVTVRLFIEGEEEVGSDTLVGAAREVPGAAEGRRHRDRRLRQLGHRRPGPDHQPARPGPGRHRGPHPDPRRALRHVGRPGAGRADDAEPRDRLPARRRGQRRDRGPAQRARGRRRLPRGAAARRVRRCPRHRVDRQRLDRRAALDQALAQHHRPRRPEGRRCQQHPGPGREGPDLAADRPGRHDRERARPAWSATSRRTCPWGATLTHTVVDTGEATQIDATGPAYDAARAAFSEAWDGTAPVDMGVGGSIPFIAEFLEAFPEASVLVTGVEDPDTRAHGANEGLHLAEFERVVLAEALLLRNLAG